MTARSQDQLSAQPHTRSAPQWRFAVLFLIMVNPVLFWPIAVNANGDHWASISALVSISFWTPLLVVHGIVPFLDSALGTDKYAAIEGKTPTLNRLLPALCLPAWVCVVVGACYTVSVGNLSTLELIGLVLSLGAIGGVLSINPAHELIHRGSALERNAGGVLLAGVCYGAFKVEHVRGHHLNAATSKDTASAQKGDNIFAFVVRSFYGTLSHAHHLEGQRLQRLGLNTGNLQWWQKNELVRLNLISVLFALAIYGAFGTTALIVFLLTSLVAIFELEVINFIEHYGLRRQLMASSDRYEPVKEHHSWNTNTVASNAFLFNLQRHSDHHAHAGKDYLHLSSIEGAPQLPYGYSVMFLIALCPPVWRRVMDHRIPS
jgi:alkane 1-monooxygenase